MSSYFEFAAGKTLNKNEFMLKGLIEMITSVIGTQVYDKTVYSVVEALLPFVPSLQVDSRRSCLFKAFVIQVDLRTGV